jgi:hypothetical protein
MGAVSTCVNGHVDPPRYASGSCKLCAYKRNKEKRKKGGSRYEVELGKNRRRAATLRSQALAAYGGRCACCGETEEDFLVIDHVNDDGADHRRAIRGDNQRSNAGAGRTTYRWLQDNGYPDGFQVLCANCNMAKSRPRGCPHRRE